MYAILAVVNAVLVIGMTIYTGIYGGGNFSHFTSWNASLCIAVSTIFSVCSDTVFAKLLLLVMPVATASSITVAVFSVGMTVLDIPLIQEARGMHGVAGALTGNLFIHGFGIVLVMLVFFLDVPRIKQLLSPYRSQRYQRARTAVLINFLYVSLYFTLFSPNEEYSIKWPSDSLIRFGILCSTTCISFVSVILMF